MFVGGFIRGRVGFVLMLICIGVFALFRRGGSVSVVCQNGVPTLRCGVTCGSVGLNLAMNWSFNYETEEFGLR